MEIWRTVIYDGEIYENYEVSDLGRVRSLNYMRTGQIKVLKLSEKKNGYLQVDLWKNNKQKDCLVHRLVAFTYSDLIPNDNPTEKTEIDHIDRNKHNNSVSNLRWTTRQKNMNNGGKCIRCVETGEIFDTMVQASQKIGVTKQAIANCLRGKSKTCGGFHWEFVD